MDKVVWLVNYYAMPPEHESRLRTIKFAYYLNKLGYKTIIISSSNLHNKNLNLINNDVQYQFAQYGDLDFIHIKSSQYVSNGVKRFISLFQFHLKLHRLRNLFSKPDIIVHACMPPFGLPTLYTAYKLKAKYIAEIQDLWPESFVAFNLIKRNNPLLKLLYLIEKYVYTKSDAIVFSMEGGRDYLRKKKWLVSEGGSIKDNAVHYINNGVDLEDFNNYKDNYVLEDIDLSDSSFKVIYVGSIRLANDVKRIIEAAEHLLKYTELKFLIYGDGGERENLIKYCEEKNISNVIFKQKWVDPQFIPYILSRSSLNLLNYFPNEIFKYGGSQSKSFQYMASGKPICSNLRMGYCPITKYQLGIAQEFETSMDYAKAIIYFFELNKVQYEEICSRSLNAASNYDYKRLVSEFSKIL